MIALLSGIVAEKLIDRLIIDCAGVGYGVYVANEDYGALVLGQPAKLYIYEHIREQQHDLFGFVRRDTQTLFEQLLGVNGVGPKMALNVLSTGAAATVRTAIASGDTKYIQAASGVGKRVAERIIVELKDKVGLEGVDLGATTLLQRDSSLDGDEAIQALVALGYTPQDVARALQTVDASLPVEDRIKQALRSR